jgi:UDP-N-acetylglucosamine 2-epimerase (non-hydrolysing)
MIVGTRPNFMKVAPIIRAVDRYNNTPGSKPIEYALVHTGQHYDFEMSKVFFKDLEIPEPDIYLGVGSGTHAQQTARVMLRLEKILTRRKTDLVLVVGDVNSTLAGALAAVKMHIPVAHVEAGLRSYDRDMPEEINRLLTDAISDYLFTPSTDADENLKEEGISEDRIFQVGDIMADSLLANQTKAEKSRILSQLGVSKQKYALLTLHRPSNVDDRQSLSRIINAVRDVSKRIPVVFPAHPRTRKNIGRFRLTRQVEDKYIRYVEPLGYLDFLKLMMHARFVITDSGGIQEETSVLGIPCLTLRNVTERPLNLLKGSTILVGSDPQKIISEAFKILDGEGKERISPKPSDGKVAERIVNILAREGRKHENTDVAE